MLDEGSNHRLLLEGGHLGLRCSLLTLFLMRYGGEEPSVAVISNLTAAVYDVCDFKATVFGKINHFWCCNLFFKPFDSPWLIVEQSKQYIRLNL